MRIVSLLPSATEIVCELGLQESLVGVTHECDYPPQVRQLPKVTRTLIPVDASSREIDGLVRDRLKTNRALYTLDMPVLTELRPELIVTQALCDVCAVAEAEVTAAACSLPGTPRVINLEPMSLAEVFSTLRAVADAAGVTDRAARVVGQLEARVQAVRDRSAQVLQRASDPPILNPTPSRTPPTRGRVTRRPRVVLLEWIDPPFSSGHWSPELVSMAGGEEQLGRPRVASRTLQWQEVIEAQPEVLVIACCGFDLARTLQDLPILRSYPGWSQIPAVRDQRVYVVDGNAYFSRPGPRLVESLELIAHAIHPDVHPAPAKIPAARRLTTRELLGD